MNKILKWTSTVEYFNEDGIELNLKHLTQTEIKKQFKKIKHIKEYEHDKQLTRHRYIIRKNPTQGRLFNQ